MLKPFDESEDNARADDSHAQRPVMTMALVATLALAIASLVMIVRQHPRALQMFTSALALSAVTAGLEWNAGLRARALNQLCRALVFLAIAVLI